MSHPKNEFSSIYVLNYERSIDFFGFHKLFNSLHEEIVILADWSIILDEVLLGITRRR